MESVVLNALMVKFGIQQENNAHVNLDTNGTEIFAIFPMNVKEIEFGTSNTKYVYAHKNFTGVVIHVYHCQTVKMGKYGIKIFKDVSVKKILIGMEKIANPAKMDQSGINKN